MGPGPARCARIWSMARPRCSSRFSTPFCHALSSGLSQDSVRDGSAKNARGVDLLEQVVAPPLKHAVNAVRDTPPAGRVLCALASHLLSTTGHCGRGRRRMFGQPPSQHQFCTPKRHRLTARPARPRCGLPLALLCPAKLRFDGLLALARGCPSVAGSEHAQGDHRHGSHAPVALHGRRWHAVAAECVVVVAHHLVGVAVPPSGGGRLGLGGGRHGEGEWWVCVLCQSVRRREGGRELIFSRMAPRPSPSSAANDLKGPPKLVSPLHRSRMASSPPWIPADWRTTLEAPRVS